MCLALTAFVSGPEPAQSCPPKRQPRVGPGWVDGVLLGYCCLFDNQLVLWSNERVRAPIIVLYILRLQYVNKRFYCHAGLCCPATSTLLPCFFAISASGIACCEVIQAEREFSCLCPNPAVRDIRRASRDQSHQESSYPRFHHSTTFFAQPECPNCAEFPSLTHARRHILLLEVHDGGLGGNTKHRSSCRFAFSPMITVSPPCVTFDFAGKSSSFLSSRLAFWLQRGLELPSRGTAGREACLCDT